MSDSGQSRDLEGLLEYIREGRGFDFSGYKRSTLARRIDHRMEEVGARNYADYRGHLEADPGEFDRLFNTILINVTGFFRDPEAWDYLSAHIVPEITKRKESGDTIRAWCVGCASGEEAYTLAIALLEELGSNERAGGDALRVYGTDLDEEALATARAGRYQHADVEPIPPHLRERYLAWQGGEFSIRPDLRRTIIFGRHDLLRDAPISNIDLLVCRNTLMYFNTEAQVKAAARLHFALNHDGYAFLGKAEMLLAKIPLFEVVTLQHRIFRKSARPAMRQRWAPGALDHSASSIAQHIGAAQASGGRVAAQVLIDRQGWLRCFNEESRRLFALTAEDTSRPFHELELASSPADLVEPMNRAKETGSAVWIESVARPLTSLQRQVFDILIVPLIDAGQFAGVTITFIDSTRHHEAGVALERTAHELETVREELRSAHEEYESANEDLRSANDDLKAVNDELQATNRELHLAVEELESANRRLRAHGEDLAQARAILDSIVKGARVALLAVDAELRVVLWSEQAAELFGCAVEDSIGRHLFSIATRVPTETLSAPLRAVIRDGTRREEAIHIRDRAGTESRHRVALVPLWLPGKATAGATLLIETLATPVETDDHPKMG